MEKKEVKAKKTKNTELEVISKDMNPSFKYTDHLVIDPLIIGGFKVGKTNISPTNIRRIDTIIATSWQTHKKKTKIKYSWGLPKSPKLKKVDSHWMPTIEDVSELVDFDPTPVEPIIKTYNLYMYFSLVELQMEEGKLIVQRHQKQLAIDAHQTGGHIHIVAALLVQLAEIDAKLANISVEIHNRANPQETPFDLSYTSEEKVVEQKKLSYIDKLINDLSIFKGHYGGNPALIKGYLINGELITNNERLEEILKQDIYIHFESIKTIVKVFDIQNDKIVSQIRILNNYKFGELSKLDRIIPILPMMVKFKLAGYKNSNDFFGTSKLRTPLKDLDPSKINWKLESVSIVRNKNKHSTYVVVIEHPDTKDNIKFTLSDCVFTNDSLAGYNLPMDKTISVGSIVRIKDNKLSRYGIRVTDNAEVVKIRINSSSKKIAKNCNNRRMDIVLIKLNTGKTINVYAQDLKFIENKKQQDVNASIKKENSRDKSSFKSYEDLLSQELTNYLTHVTAWQTTTTAQGNF